MSSLLSDSSNQKVPPPYVKLAQIYFLIETPIDFALMMQEEVNLINVNVNVKQSKRTFGERRGKISQHVRD